MRILGIDPGLATIGLGLIEGTSSEEFHALDWLTITTKAGAPLSERLGEIAKDLREYLDAHPPDLVVVERLFFAKNERSALDVAHARGVILLTVTELSLPLLEPTPPELKLAIAGNGRAEKGQLQRMLKNLLHLTEIPKPDDAADALALAIYGALCASSPLAVAHIPSPRDPPGRGRTGRGLG